MKRKTTATGATDDLVIEFCGCKLEVFQDFDRWSFTFQDLSQPEQMGNAQGFLTRERAHAEGNRMMHTYLRQKFA